MAQSILGGLFGPPVKQYDPAEAWAQKDSGERFDEATYRAGQGLGQVIGGLAGADMRPDAEKRKAAVERIKAQLAASGLEPGSDEFYKAFATALQREGFPAEALEIGQQWQTERRARSKDELAIRDMKRKEAKDITGSADAQERNAIARARLKTTGPEVLQLLAQLDTTTEPNARAAILKRINFLSTRDGVRFEDLGDRVNVTDLQGNVIRTDTKGLTAKDEAKREDAAGKGASAYTEAIAGLQKQLDSIAELYNSPGIEGITGRLGRLVGTEGWAGQLGTTISSSDARAALALHEQVAGGTFLAGLVRLKEASKTGATGLGAVSEREGDKVQSDAAALNRAQDAPQYRAQLKTYADFLVGLGDRLATAATTDQLEPKRLAPKAFSGPARGARPAAPAVKPAAPAPAAPASGWSAKRK